MRVFRSLVPPLLFCIIAGCSSSTTPSSQNAPPPTPSANDIGITLGARTKTTTAFTPNPKTVALGGGASVSVRWINQDISGGDYTTGTAVSHQIMSDNGAFATSPLLGGNATYSISLTTAGSYPYHCNIHPNMVGTITVNP
ncbi:MAG TPA: plastocyanin/azurin family copper-binding protein [Acidimicrobiales bacterium]|nr:plastocyanin/azurin family copper-binding protein [Gemmatimonadales bacterium]HWW54664.1 plastocyanin/azurin family copper-binding protein [Acidimicrobiales bacterium]